MSSPVAYPVQVLREHITALEAALSVCLADPGGKPVHKLRTETRRVEALLLLLALVPGLPEHRKQSSTLLRSLARLRRAAGAVRDLDVHRKMLETFATTENAIAANGAGKDGHAPAKTASAKKKSSGAKAAADGSQAARREAAALLSDSAEELRKRMGKERDKAATALQHLLVRRQAKTALASEALLKALEPAEDLVLPAADLLRDAESVLARDGLLQPEAVARLKEERLHQVRKAAKAARYVAESLPDDLALAEAARGFESLQEAGGQWHDALELARAARRYFGKGHELTATYRRQRDDKLGAYRAALNARTKRPKRGPSRAKKVSVERDSAA